MGLYETLSILKMGQALTKHPGFSYFVWRVWQWFGYLSYLLFQRNSLKVKNQSFLHVICLSMKKLLLVFVAQITQTRLVSDVTYIVKKLTLSILS